MVDGEAYTVQLAALCFGETDTRRSVVEPSDDSFNDGLRGLRSGKAAVSHVEYNSLSTIRLSSRRNLFIYIRILNQTADASRSTVAK